jgi:monoamine oxidase
MNAGPARIPQHHTTLDYCRELGVPIEVFVNANPDAYVLNDPEDGAHGPLTGQPVRRRAARADLDGYVAELLAKCNRQGALDTLLTADDRDALVEYLRSFGSLTPDDRYLGGGNRGWAEPPGAATQAGRLDPPYPVADLLASRVGLAFAFDQQWDQAMPMFQPVGGMDRIPHALSAAIRGPQRFGAVVTGITVGSDGVDVTWNEADGKVGRSSADYCVCTIPPPVLRTIPHNLGDDVTAALAGLVPAPVGKIGLEFRRRFWEEDDRILGGITDTNLETGTIFYPSYGFHGERGVVIGYYSFFSDSLGLARLSPRERVQRALEVGARIHGDAYRDEFESAFSVHWQEQEFSNGGWVEWQEDRSVSTAYRTLLQPVERLYFAGDHLSYVTAWQHGAIESARYVVTQLHQRVLAG